MSQSSTKRPELSSSSPGLRAYFNDLKKCHVLTEEEEIAFFEVISEHSQEILDLEKQMESLDTQLSEGLEDKDELELERKQLKTKKRLVQLWAMIDPTFQEVATRNQRLVVTMAIKNKGSFPLEEMIGAGNEGLRKAILMFRPERGNKFSTYAVWWIKQHIRKEKQLNKTVHIPSNVSEQHLTFSHFETCWMNLTGEIPSDAELAALIINNYEEVNEAKKIFSKKHPETPIHGAINKNQEFLRIKTDLKKIRHTTRLALAYTQLEEAGHKKPTKKEISDQDTANFIDSIRKLARELEEKPAKNQPAKKVKSKQPVERFITPAKVRKLRSVKSASTVIKGDVVSEDGEAIFSLIDIISNAQGKIDSPEQQLEIHQIQEMVRESLIFLTPFEKRVIKARFGIDDSHEKTLQEIGEETNLTRERIRQIEAIALRKLRNHLRNNAKTKKAVSAYFS